MDKVLVNGDLTKDEFEWLIKSKKDFAEFFALKRIVLSKVALERFLNGVIDVTISTAFRVFL